MYLFAMRLHVFLAACAVRSDGFLNAHTELGMEVTEEAELQQHLHEHKDGRHENALE